MVFQSTYKPVAMTSEQAFLLYASPDGLKSLMPDQVTEWESGADWCRFLIKGMGHVTLKIGEKEAHQKLTYRPEGKMPFDFDLQLLIQKKAAVCEIKVLMDADLSNPLVAMLAQRPLQNLVNEMAARL